MKNNLLKMRYKKQKINGNLKNDIEILGSIYSNSQDKLFDFERKNLGIRGELIITNVKSKDIEKWNDLMWEVQETGESFLEALSLIN